MADKTLDELREELAEYKRYGYLCGNNEFTQAIVRRMAEIAIADCERRTKTRIDYLTGYCAKPHWTTDARIVCQYLDELDRHRKALADSTGRSGGD